MDNADDGRFLARPATRTWRCPPGDEAATRFHEGLPGYDPTPLVEAPRLAKDLGVGRVFVKDESSRFGLPAFKILGVSWAVYRALSERHGAAIEPATFDGLRQAVAGTPPISLVTATDGNHGRALARIAAMLGAPARVFVPDHLPPKVIAAIEGEGAAVTHVAGSYDDAVREAASLAAESADALLIQDTAWPGYESIPTWTVEGYATLLLEADAQLRQRNVDAIDLVSVPTGVGSLLQAAISHYRRDSVAIAPVVLGVEPYTAACVQASVRAGRLASVATGQTVMAGLNCETPSSLAWPVIQAGLDACIAVSDDEAIQAMDDLAALGVPAGPSGAAALAGIRAVIADPGRRASLELGPDATIVLVCTEGRASGAA